MPSKRTADQIRDHLRIDLDRLDEELVNHPGLAFQFGEEEAVARLELARAKAALDVAEADLQLGIRQNPDEFNVPKDLKEAGIKAAVIMQPEYKKANAAVDDAQFLVGRAAALVAAWTDRRRMLEREVELLSINYFSTPRVRDAGVRTAVEEAGKRTAREPLPATRRPRGGR